MSLGLSNRVSVYISARAAAWMLQTEEEIPEKDRPHFLCRHMSCAQEIEYPKMLNHALDGETDEECNKRLNKALLVSVIGWAGMKDVYGNNVPSQDLEKNIDSIYITSSEKWEIAGKIVKALRLTEDELKNSESQQGAQPVSSAPIVPPVAA